MFNVVGPSDVLRTGAAIFLLTRSSSVLKGIGLLWLASSVYSLSQRERALATGKPSSAPTLTDALGLKRKLSLDPFRPDAAPVVRDRDALIPTSLDGYPG